MTTKLKLRKGDVVRLKPVTIRSVNYEGRFTIMEGAFEHDEYDDFDPDMVEEILLRKETPEEELERLRAENAKLQMIAEAFRKKTVGHKIEWSGGKCPVDESALVVVWHRDGRTVTEQACAFDWDHAASPFRDSADDVIAYMELPD
jgi:hypothetical protein